MLPCVVKSLHLQNNLSVQSHTLQLWFARVGEASKAVELSIRKQLTTSELTRLNSIKNEYKQREYLLSRALMRHALFSHFPNTSDHWDFVENSNAFPTILNLPANTFLSLSHSNGLISFAIANSPLGVDLEMIKDRRFQETASVFMNDEELKLLIVKKEQPEYFYRLWCAKEAYYKSLSSHIQSSTSLKHISIFHQIQNKHQQTLLEWRIDNYILAVFISGKMPDRTTCNIYLTDLQLDLITTPLS